MPVATNKKLYAQVKADADKKFLAPTSAYKSAWIVAEYKRRGGVYAEDGDKRGLTQWFKEKWVDLERPKKNGKGYEPCGRSAASAHGIYPVCRPSKRVAKDTPDTVSDVSRNKRKLVATMQEKQRIKHKGRVAF